jgi:hypothetical protein
MKVRLETPILNHQSPFSQTMLTCGNETVPNYQPQTAQQIFNRVMFNRDVATGKNPAVDSSTTGPNSAFSKSEIPAAEELPSCYLWDVLETCTEVQKDILKNGSAVVENFILVGYKQENGSTIVFNGTNVGGSRTGVSPLAPISTTSNAAKSIMTSCADGKFLLSAVAVVGLQTLFF